jgi:hypothetical protein
VVIDTAETAAEATVEAMAADTVVGVGAAARLADTTSRAIKSKFCHSLCRRI